MFGDKILEYWDDIEKDLKAAFEIASKQADTAVPLDWMYNNTPELWSINGKTVEYDFIMNCYPSLTKDIYATLSSSLMF